MNKITESAALHRMAAFCSTKEYCVQDIRRKITASGLSAEECDRIIDRLCAGKFISEERFTRAFVKDKLKFNKWGRIKIRYELQKKGIPAEISESILDETDETAYKEMLKSILTLKQKSIKGKNPRDIYAGLFRFASGRGFESQLISACLKEILNSNGDEEYPE